MRHNSGRCLSYGHCKALCFLALACVIYIYGCLCVCSRTDEERFGKIIYACMEIIIKGIHDGIDQRACMRKREGRVCRSTLTEWALLPVLTVRKENINKNNSIPTSFLRFVFIFVAAQYSFQIFILACRTIQV